MNYNREGGTLEGSAPSHILLCGGAEDEGVSEDSSAVVEERAGGPLRPPHPRSDSSVSTQNHLAGAGPSLERCCHSSFI